MLYDTVDLCYNIANTVLAWYSMQHITDNSRTSVPYRIFIILQVYYILLQ